MTCESELANSSPFMKLKITSLRDLTVRMIELREALVPPIPIPEVDVTNLFECIKRYTHAESEVKPEYQQFQDELKDLEIACAAVNAVGNGVHDDTCAIRAAIALVPDAGFFNAMVAPGLPRRPAGGTAIRFPTPSKFFRVTETIVIPWIKAVSFQGAAAAGATIRLANDYGETIDGVNYIFEVRSGTQYHEGQKIQGLDFNALVPRSFERLNLVGGGIVFEPHLKLWQSIRDCVFRCTPSWAIDVQAAPNGDSDVVNLEVSRCVFSGCAGGVRAAHPQLVGWSIDQCRFQGNTGVDVYIDQGEVHLVDCEFAGRILGLRHIPYLQIERPSYATTVTNCRFGAEEKPPRDLVVIGPLVGKGPTPTAIDFATGRRDVVFDGCVFGAAMTSPDDSSAQSVFRLRLAISGFRIRSCAAWSFASLLWEEAYESALQGAVAQWNLGQGATSNQRTIAGGATQNVLAHVTLLGTVGEVFTRGGRGFEVVGAALLRRLGRISAETRATRNLLRDTEAKDLANSPEWEVPTNVNASQGLDASSPNGVTAWKMTRMKGQEFNARVEQKLDPDTGYAILRGGSAVYSIWLRADAGKSAIASLEAVIDTDGDNVFALAKTPILRLSDGWRRFTLLIERLPELKGLTLDGHPIAQSALDFEFPVPRVRLNHGFAGDDIGSQIGSVIWAAEPQLELGASPTPYVPGPPWPQPHTERQEQSVVLGGMVLGYGDAPTGYGVYTAGDVVFNTAPIPGGVRGWVCIEGISQGPINSWLPFGIIHK